MKATNFSSHVTHSASMNVNYKIMKIYISSNEEKLLEIDRLDPPKSSKQPSW